jgi:hypothetical protein
MGFEVPPGRRTRRPVRPRSDQCSWDIRRGAPPCTPPPGDWRCRQWICWAAGRRPAGIAQTGTSAACCRFGRNRHRCGDDGSAAVWRPWPPPCSRQVWSRLASAAPRDGRRTGPGAVELHDEWGSGRRLAGQRGRLRRRQAVRSTWPATPGAGLTGSRSAARIHGRPRQGRSDCPSTTVNSLSARPTTFPHRRNESAPPDGGDGWRSGVTGGLGSGGWSGRI